MVSHPVRKSSVCILMATYNGEKYLQPQIDSICNQTMKDWTLFIRDDGSCDQTNEILDLAATKDHRIKVIKDERGPQKSAQANFYILSETALETGFEYIFFSDQDDVWENSKLELMLSRMKKLDYDYPNLPLMLHSDLMVVDKNNNLIEESFFRYQGINHQSNNALGVLLAQNFVTGCASLVNNSLLSLASPFPNSIIMHDWWLAQLAVCSGKLEFIETALVRYRQHDGNIVGAKKQWVLLNPFSQNTLNRWSKSKHAIGRTIEQAQVLRNYIKNFNLCRPNLIDDIRTINAYVNLPKLPRLARLKVLLKYKIRRQSFLMNLAFIIRILTLKL